MPQHKRHYKRHYKQQITACNNCCAQSLQLPHTSASPAISSLPPPAYTITDSSHTAMPNSSSSLLFAQNGDLSAHLLLNKANRHGLITGATGTGKTVSLQRLAEGFSQAGVPVFMSDVKGDLAGISQTGNLSEKILGILQKRGLDAPTPTQCPTTLWDVFGNSGHPVRATISDMGPLLLARMLDLNDTQSGILQLAFRIADDEGMLLLDLKDLRAMCAFVGENARSLRNEYGNISSASVGAIQRRLIQLEEQGAELFFGEPMLNIDDLLQTDSNGHGVVNILSADQLLNAPRLYASFLLWLLSELFEQLPEVGDPQKPKLVFFFDEAHLLFKDAPKVLLERIELVVRLIRSKGVGVFFVTQNPADIPDSVLGQLGNRVQHALRAFSARDKKAVAAAADTMRDNPDLDLRDAITELAVGEALVSFLDEKGSPSVTQRLYVIPPGSQIAPITDNQRKALMRHSLVAGVYDDAVDNESAYEQLQKRTSERMAEEAEAEEKEKELKQKADEGGILSTVSDILIGTGNSRRQSVLESTLKSIGRDVGRRVVRNVLGSILGGRR